MCYLPGILISSCKTDPITVEPATSAVTFDPTRHCSAPGQRHLYRQTVQWSQHPGTEEQQQRHFKYTIVAMMIEMK